MTLGRKLFFYRSITPLPVVALALYFLTRARPPTGQTDALLDALGPLLGFGGAALRFAVTGAVPEGTSGQNDRLEAVVLNTRGPYAWVRNPLYVGNLGLVLGLLCVANNPWVWAIGLGFFFFEYAFIIRAEEAFLRTRFTHAFDDYCAKVPRWIPRSTAAFPGQLRDGGFDWRRALKKEHNPLMAWLTGLFFLYAWESGAWVPFAVAEGVALVVYFSIKAWKHRS